MLADLADGADAVLVVGPRQRSPHTVLPAPVLTAPDGRVVPAAWLPATSADDLARFRGFGPRQVLARTLVLGGYGLGAVDLCDHPELEIGSAPAPATLSVAERRGSTMRMAMLSCPRRAAPKWALTRNVSTAGVAE